MTKVKNSLINENKLETFLTKIYHELRKNKN